jgi:hypothetical protein
MQLHKGLLSAPLALIVLLGSGAAARAANHATVNCNRHPAGSSCSATAGSLEASIVPSAHDPKVNAKWPLKVTATLRGKPARASAVYQFLFAGQVVSTQYPLYKKHFMFTGSFSDTLVFPPDSEGEPLTLQVVIGSGSTTVALDWSITPKK